MVKIWERFVPIAPPFLAPKKVGRPRLSKSQLARRNQKRNRRGNVVVKNKYGSVAMKKKRAAAEKKKGKKYLIKTWKGL